MKHSDLRTKSYKKHVNLKELSREIVSRGFYSTSFSGVDLNKVPTLGVINVSFDEEIIKSNTLCVEGRPSESTKLMKAGGNKQFSVSSNSMTLSGANIGYDPDSFYLKSH
jgi:hypothetical protein